MRVSALRKVRTLAFAETLQPAARLHSLRLEAATDIDALAAATVSLIDDLRPPTAFYVRLLDPSAAEYPTVERFFRDVVDPVIVERGFTPREMGRETPETAFMNEEIFNVLHRTALVVVDLTAMRTNCLMELGYALGRRRRFIISARDGTRLGFDHDKLPTYFWKDAGTRGRTPCCISRLARPLLGSATDRRLSGASSSP